MAVTKGRSAITQLTASGTSTTLDVSTAYGATLLWSHSNGTGTVTVAAVIRVQVKASSGSRWVDHEIVPASTTTGSTDSGTMFIPPEVASVQIIYTAPTGATGPTLDAEIATITGI